MKTFNTYLKEEFENKKIKVFLGGTCNESKWREKLIPMLEEKEIDYFNPVVKDWKPEDQKRELIERENSDYVLYVISPKMTGIYSIAEVVDDSNKRPNKTIFYILSEDEGKIFDKSQLKSLNSVGDMIKRNKAFWAKDFNDIVKKISERS